MKKRLNVIVLVLEIAAIITLHAVKIGQAEKKADFRNQSLVNSSPRQPVKTSLPYILINVK